MEIKKEDVFRFIKTLDKDECIGLNNAITDVKKYKTDWMKAINFSRGDAGSDFLRMLADNNFSLDQTLNILSKLKRDIDNSEVVISGAMYLGNGEYEYDSFSYDDNDLQDALIQKFNTGKFSVYDIIRCTGYTEDDIMSASRERMLAVTMNEILCVEDEGTENTIQMLNDIALSVYGEDEAELCYKAEEYKECIGSIHALPLITALGNAIEVLLTIQNLDKRKPYFKCCRDYTNMRFLTFNELCVEAWAEVKACAETEEKYNKFIGALRKYNLDSIELKHLSF